MKKKVIAPTNRAKEPVRHYSDIGNGPKQSAASSEPKAKKDNKDSKAQGKG